MNEVFVGFLVVGLGMSVASFLACNWLFSVYLRIIQKATNGKAHSKHGIIILRILLIPLSIFLVFILIIVIPGIFDPSLRDWGEARTGGVRSAESACKSNLNQIQKACCMYADAPENHGRFPQKFSDLYPKYIIDLRNLFCPFRPNTNTFDPKIPADMAKLDAEAGYELFSGASPDRPNDILAYERHPHDKNCNVIRVSGSEMSVPEEKLKLFLSNPSAHPLDEQK